MRRRTTEGRSGAPTTIGTETDLKAGSVGGRGATPDFARTCNNNCHVSGLRRRPAGPSRRVRSPVYAGRSCGLLARRRAGTLGRDSNSPNFSPNFDCASGDRDKSDIETPDRRSQALSLRTPPFTGANLPSCERRRERTVIGPVQGGSWGRCLVSLRRTAPCARKGLAAFRCCRRLRRANTFLTTSASRIPRGVAGIRSPRSGPMSSAILDSRSSSSGTRNPINRACHVPLDSQRQEAQ